MMYRMIVALALLANYGLETAAAPENDRCVDAITLEPFDPVDGDNTDANFDYVNQGVCGPRSDRRALWYEIIGKGLPVTVYVCTNNEKITDFGVFETCNTQICVGAPGQQTEAANCDEDNAQVYEFEAALGEDYFVHVRADVEPEGSNFTIWYTEPTEAPTAAPSGSEMMASPWSIASTLAATVAMLGATFLGA